MPVCEPLGTRFSAESRASRVREPRWCRHPLHTPPVFGFGAAVIWGAVNAGRARVAHIESAGVVADTRHVRGVLLGPVVATTPGRKSSDGEDRERPGESDARRSTFPRRSMPHAATTDELSPVPVSLYVDDAQPAVRPATAGRGFSYVGSIDRRCATRTSSIGCAVWPCRRRGRTCGSASTRAVTSRRPGATPRAASSTDTTPRGDGARRRPSTSRSSIRSRAPTAARQGRFRHAPTRPVARPVVATAVWLLDRTLIRVGNSEYSAESFGLTTLLDARRHRIDASALHGSSASRASSTDVV